MAASGFNLTAQINLRGPSNVGVIVSDIKKQIGSINANLNVTISANAAKNVSQLNNGLQTLNQTFKNVQASATSAAAAIAQFNAAVGNTQISSYQNNINSSIAATQKLGQSQAQTAKAISTSSSEMEEFGKQAGLAVRRFAAFSAVTSVIFGVTNSISKGISSFIDFDKELVRLQQVTGESASGLSFLQNTITSLSTNLGVGSAELLNVSSTLAQAGLSARDTEKALKALALSSLAPSFDSMNETVEGSIALMRQFGIGAGDLTKALGSVNAVAAKFAVEASDIISAIQRTGGVFASASKGVSEGTQALNEFVAVFTSVRATTRESAETIATGLRTIFTRVQREGTIDALKEYGVNLTDLDGKFVGAYKAVELLSRGLNSIDPRDLKFSRIVEELGGFRQIGKVIPLIQEFGTAQQALSVAQSGQNSLTTDAVKAQLSLANQISKVREEFLALFREIGASNTFQNMATGALQVVRAIVKVADAVKGVLPVLAVLGISKGLDSLIKFGSGLYTGIRKGPDNKSGGFAQGGPVSYFATGGLVPGSGNSDSVNARLTPGEFVMSKPAVKAIGADNLYALNKNRGGIIPKKYYSGGVAGLEKLSPGESGNKIADYIDFNEMDNTSQPTKSRKNNKRSKKSRKELYGFQFKDNVSSEIRRIPINEKEIEQTLSSNDSFKDYINSRAAKYANGRRNQFFTSQGLAFENFLFEKVLDTKGYKPAPSKTYPLDFIPKIAGLPPVEAKFTYDQVPDAYILNKRLRYNLIRNKKETIAPLTRKEQPDNIQLGPTVVYEMESGLKNKIFSPKAKEVTKLQRQERLDNKLSKIKNLGLPLNAGETIQRFDIGGKSVRRKIIIDSDKFRNIKNPEEAAKVAEGMKLLGATTEADYGIKLSALAGQLRESGGIKRFRVMAGAAGNRKTSLAMGRGMNDNAKLREVKRKFALHPSDLDGADEVMSLTTTLKQSKLDYMGKADRIYSKDSSTDSEQKLVKLFTEQRNTTKDSTLLNRATGTTENLSSDYGEQTASLLSQFGSAHEKGPKKGKVVVLGEKTDKNGNPLYQTRIKRGEELPELVRAQAMTSMAASPFTKGHSEAVIGTMLEEARKKNPKATHKDLLIQLAPDLSLSGGSQGMEHGSRYGIFPAAFRRELIKSVHPDIMVSSADRPSDTGINPRIAEIEKGISGRRRFAVADQGAPVIISKAPHENPEGVMARYSEAGLSPKNIARTSDEVGNTISGTDVRKSIISKDYDKLDRAVLPQVGAALKVNQPQIKNRSLMVPLVQQSIGNFVQSNKDRIKQQTDKILAGASGGPFTRMTPKFKEAHPDLVKKIQQLKKQRDSFEKEAYGDPAHDLIRQMSSSHPDIYGLSSKRQKPLDVSVSTDDIKQHILNSSKSSSFFKSGLSFSPSNQQVDTPSPLLQAIKQSVSSTPAPIKTKANTTIAFPKGSGDLPTDSKTIATFLKGTSIPSDPRYGVFAGKTVDIDMVKKVWRKSYAQMSEEKTTNYTAVKELLSNRFSAKPMNTGGVIQRFSGGKIQRFPRGGNVQKQKLANVGVAEEKKQTSINQTAAQALLEKNAGKSPVIRRILSKPTAVRDFAQTLKKQGVTIPPFPKFVGSGMANAVFDIGNKKMLKVSLTGFGDNMMAGNFFGEDVAEKMGMTGNYQLPIGIPGVAGYSSRVDTGVLSSAIQDKAVMKIKGRNKTKDADELIKRLRKQKGLTGIDLHDDNIGYRYNPKTKKQEPVIIDGLVVPDDKLPPGFKFSDHFKNGGQIQRFPRGGEVMAGDVVEPPATTAIKSSAREVIKALGLEKAAAVGGISPPEVYPILNKRTPTPKQASIQAAILAEFIREQKLKASAKRGGQTRKENKATSKGLVFGAAGLFGSAFAAQPVFQTIQDNKLKNPKKQYTVAIYSGIYKDQDGIKEIDSDFDKDINKSTKRAAKKVKKQEMAAQEAEVQRILDKFTSPGRKLALDFDETLAFKTMPVRDPNSPKFSEFSDATKVTAALEKANLSILGRNLVSLVGKKPELLKNIRIITARPAATLPLLQSWLAKKGLPLQDGQFKGLGGPTVSGSDIAKLKAAELKSGDIFVDDNKKNFEEAKKRSDEGIDVYRYRGVKKLKRNAQSLDRTEDIKGNLLEGLMRQLGAVGSPKGNGFDFMNGLGKKVSEKFEPKIPPKIPTDVKRTLAGPSTIKDNIITYLKVKGYNDGGNVQKFADGGSVPALVSNGEAYVPPAMAKKIGYGKLNRMNQADRNGMSRFSDGGISVFKGPGTGTSDSIPANLPVGSFIIREKATKALGLNRGGAVAIRQKFPTGGVAQLTPPLPPSPLKKPDPNVQVKAVYQDKEMDAIKKKWPIGTKIADGKWKLPGHKSIGVGQFAGDHKALTDFGGSGWKMRVDPKTDNDNILIADWFGKNKSLFSGYKIATNTDKPVWSAYVSRGTGPEIQKAAQKAQSDLGQFITLNQAYDTTDTMIPGTGISGRFEIRGDERSGTPRAKEIVDTINERRKATTKYRNFYLLYKQSPGFQQGFPSSTSGDRGVPGTHYYQWLLGQKKLAIQGKKVDRAKEFEAAQNEEIKLIESVLKEKTPEYSFNSQQSSSTSPKTRLAPPPPPPKKFAGGGLVSLYHGSNTGVNDNVLKSFKEKGALSNIATGYGQGAGFYVYSGKEKAKQQAMMRVKKGLGSFTVVSGDTEGKPMVVSFKELLDPATWDLDYELNKGPIVEWLVKNYDQLKDKLVPTENLTGIKNIVKQDRSQGIMSSGIRVQEGDQTMTADTGQEMVVKGGARKTLYSGTESDLREGQLVGQIMGRLQSQDPKMVGDFENTFFKSPALASGEWDNLALKYVGSKPLKPINIETFADGGNISKFDRGEYVPAMVSTGEAFVPPATARSIGYGKLAAMNQADRNGMRSFASGGISVFKGPGTGTSDSIGPIALPVGSFVIRQAATKALGFSSGGSVGIQKFATGSPGGVGSSIESIIVKKEEKEQLTLDIQGLEKQLRGASGAARILLESKIKDIAAKLATTTADLDTAILDTATEFNGLSDAVRLASEAQELEQAAVSQAQVELVEQMKSAGNVFAGGRKFEDLDNTEQQQAIDEARNGSYKDSSGVDLFETQNTAINTAQTRLDTATSAKTTAETEKTEKFGDAKTTKGVERRSLATKGQREKDEKFFEYQGRQSGTSAASYKYGLAKDLGQAAYQVKNQYQGNVESMSYGLVGKQEGFSDIKARAEQAKTVIATSTATPEEKAAASTQLADANSELARAASDMAKNIRELNPTLDMNEVQVAAKDIAGLLSDGKLEEAQARLTDTLGSISNDAEGNAQAMNIAMQQIAKRRGVDIGIIEREFSGGAGQKMLDRQNFIAGKEGQRFGVLAEMAPDLTKRFSDMRAGQFGGNVSDFISGKGGAYSQAFAKMGGMTTLSMGIAAAPGLVQKAMGDPTSSQGAATYAGAQGAASTLGAGLQFAAKTGPFAPFVAAGAAVAALATAFKDGRNAFIEFEKNLRSQNIQRALEGTASGFEALGRDAKDLAAQRQVSEKLVTAGKEAEASTNIDQTVPKTFFVNLLDSMGIMGGGKDSVDRSKILEKEGTGAYLSSLDMFGGASQRRAYTAAMIPEQAQSNAKQYSEIATQAKQLIEVKGRAGQTFSDVKTSPEYANLAKNIALSNTAVQEQILAIDNSTSYRTTADREAAKEAIIRAHADKEISKMMLSSDRARAAADLEKTSRSFTMSFKRLFENMEASVNRTNAELAKFNNALDSNVAAMTGSGKNSSNTELESLEVLKNPRAYSQDRVDSANNKAGSIFGFDSQIVSGLSGLGEKLETSLLSSINSTISKNPGASDTKIAIDLEKSIGSQVGELSLPPDLSKQLSKEIASAVGDLRKEGTKKIDIDQLTDRIPGLKNAIDSAKNAQNASVAALQNWQNNLNNYSEALNRAADMEMQAADLRRKANDIAIEGAMSLGQVLGKNYGADIGTKLRDQKVGGMAGGLTSPTDIRSRMDDLNSQRKRQEAEVKLSKNESVGGNKNSIQNVINNENALKQTNNQLRQTSAALKVLAESGSAASAALNAIQEAQRKQQGKVGLIEKLVTSGPEELFNFNKSLTSLQRMSAGQVVPQTAEERRDTLSTLNDITPLLGDSKQANNIKANVLESMLKDSGVGVSTQFKEILNALRNPESDNETQQAIKVYQQAIDVQTQANEALAQINSELANDIANTTAEAIKAALTGITLNFNQAQLDDIAKGVRAPTTVAEPKALGGLIYAAAGTMVDFKPQGTDTVPAMLTPGEFVVNRTATANNLGLLHSINSGKTSYYADGGYVSNISKPNFDSSGTTVTDKEYPVLGTWNNTKMMIGYDNVQAMPFFQTKQNFPLSELANNSFSYKEGSSKEFSTDSYILGAGQPISATTKTLTASGGADNRIYSTSSGSPGSVRPASMMTIIDADNAEADVLRQQNKEIEKNKIEAYQKRLEELESNLPSSFEVKDDFYNMGDGPIFYPTIQKAKQLSGNFKPKVTVTNTSVGGYRAQLQFDSLAKSLSDAKFGPFYGDIDKDVNQQSLPDYYIGGEVYKSLFASNVGETSSKMSSIRASLGVNPFALPVTDQQDYVNRLFHIFDRVKTAKKNLLADQAKSKSDKDIEVAAFYAKLDKIYKGTIVSEVFKGDSIDLEPFTSEDALVVYSTSLDNWNNKYIKDIEDVTKHTDKFRDLEYFGKDPTKRSINITPEENGLLTGPTKEFAWIGGGDFEFAESAQKAMNAEVEQNKDKLGGVGSSKQNTGNILLQQPDVKLPYDLSYLEYSNSTGIGGSSSIAPNEKVYWVQPLETDLSVFSNLKEKPSKLFVRDAGMKNNEPISEVRDLLNADPAVNKYFDSLKQHGIEDSRTKALETGINDKTVDITADFLKPTALGDFTNFKEAYNGTVSLRIGDYLKASAKAISSKLTKDSKDKAKQKMQNSTNDAESLTDKQYPGASLAMILGAQSLFSSGGQFELPDILGNGWFHPTLDSQYKSIYDVDLSTLRAYMGQLSQVFDGKVQRINQVMSRVPDAYRDQAVAGLTNLYGATKAFQSISAGDTSSLMGLFSKTDFQNQTPQGDPAMNRKAVELFQSLGMGVRMAGVGTEQLTADQKRQREKDLKGVKINNTGSSSNETKEISPEQLPKTYQELFNLAINPYNEFPNRDSRKGLIQQFIDAVPTARDPGTNSLLFGPQTGAMFGTALTDLQSWYGGARGGWLGTDYLTEQNTVDVTDFASGEPKSYDTRLTELEAVRKDALYQDASAGYVHIGGKQKFNTDLPDFDYYKNKEPLYKQTGGMIYASQGTLVNFEPRGTDTVPAMLTPGEFVINRRATQEHLPLLQAINNGGIKGFSEGGVVYLTDGGIAQPQTKEERRAQFQERKQARDQQLAQAKEQRNEYNRQRKAGLEAQREAMGYRNKLLREGRSVDEANQMARQYAQEEFQNNYQQIKDQERARFEELEQRKAEIQEDKARAADTTLRTQDLLARYEGRLTDVESARDTVRSNQQLDELSRTDIATPIKTKSRYGDRPSGDRFRDSLSDKDKALLDQALRQKNNERISKEIDEESVARSAETDKKTRQQAETEAKTAGNLEAARAGRSFSLTDNTGKFSTNGTVISRNDQGVSVKKDDGKVIFVPFNRLNRDTTIAVNGQWARVEAQRNKEMEEASRSNFANMEFMAKEQERAQELQEAGIKDVSTETDILRRKRDSGIKLTKDQTSQIEKEDKDKDNLVKSRAQAEAAMKEEQESAKRKARIAEEKERLGRRQEAIRETRSRLNQVIQWENQNIEQLKQSRKDTGWLGSLTRGATGLDDYEMQIKDAERKIFAARLGIGSLDDATSSREGKIINGLSPAATMNNSSYYDDGQQALDTARGLAGLPQVNSNTFQVKPGQEDNQTRGLLRVDNDQSVYKAREASFDATRDILIDAITSVVGFGAGSAALQVGKLGARAVIKQGVKQGVKYGAVSGFSSKFVKSTDDVNSGKSTVFEAAIQTGKTTATTAIVGGLAGGVGSTLGLGAQKLADKYTDGVVAQVTKSQTAKREFEGLVQKGYSRDDAINAVIESRQNRLVSTTSTRNTRPAPTLVQGNGNVTIVGSAPTPGAVVPIAPQSPPLAAPAPLTNLTLAPTFNMPSVPSTVAGQSTTAAATNATTAAATNATTAAATNATTAAATNATTAAATNATTAAATNATTAAATNATTAAATNATTAAAGTRSPSLAFRLGTWINKTSSGGKLSPKTKSNIAVYGKKYGKFKKWIGDNIPLVRPVSNLVGSILGQAKKNKMATLTTGATAYNYLSPDKKEEPQKKASGGIVYASNGALIAAKQVGSDSVPAMLTPGEFVVNRQSAQRFMPVLNAINSGHYSHGGAVKYLANGGVVQPKYLEEAGMVNNNITNMSSQSGVLTSTSANQSQPVMAKPAWVDEFASRLEQSGTVFNQGASRVEEGANRISSAGQDIANANPTLTLGGNVEIGNSKKIIQESLAGMMPIAQSAGQMGREGARQDSRRQWMDRTGDAQA